MPEREFSNCYKGKNNVKHLVINGKDVWVTRSKSFVEEMKDLGATIATPTKTNNNHFLYLFDDNLNFIKRYYMFKDLWDKKLGWFTVDKYLETLDTFEMYHQKSEQWIPCVRIHKEEQVIPTNDGTDKPTISKNSNQSSTNVANKVKERTDPWYLKPLVFLFLILFIIITISMCNHEINKGDSFGIETTIKSHGD